MSETPGQQSVAHHPAANEFESHLREATGCERASHAMRECLEVGVRIDLRETEDHLRNQGELHPQQLLSQRWIPERLNLRMKQKLVRVRH